MSLENRVKQLERHAGETAHGRETLIRYPGGEIRHCDTDGPVTETHIINCIDKETAELTLRLLNGERIGSDLTDAILRKLALDPDAVRAKARANGQSTAEIAAGELGMYYNDFQKALKLRARGKDTK